MHGIAKNISDPSWWMTVVVFGILINLVAAYIKPVIDRAVAKLYPRLLKPFRNQFAHFEAEVASLRVSPDHRVATQLLKIEYLLKFVAAVLTSSLIYIGASRVQATDMQHLASILHLLGILVGFYAAGCIGRYQHFAVTLNEAWRTMGTDSSKPE
jgi:uncharacterized protein YggT (Ycf19 family)